MSTIDHPDTHTHTPTPHVHTTHAQTPDTRDMVVVHRVFRREFRLLPQMVRRTEPGDRERAASVADWAIEQCEFLHHHHTNEDELVWPRLRERTPMRVELAQTMEAQHAAVSSLLDPVVGLARRWRDEPTVANREVLALALDPIAGVLSEHLDLEEREILPLIRAHMTAAEYGELGERGRAAIAPARMAVVLGAMLEEATPDEVVMMTAPMPLAARAMFALVGRRQYRSAMRSLRGAS